MKRAQGGMKARPARVRAAGEQAEAEARTCLGRRGGRTALRRTKDASLREAASPHPGHGAVRKAQRARISSRGRESHRRGTNTPPYRRSAVVVADGVSWRVLHQKNPLRCFVKPPEPLRCSRQTDTPCVRCTRKPFGPSGGDAGAATRGLSRQPTVIGRLRQAWRRTCILRPFRSHTTPPSACPLSPGGRGRLP